MPGSSASEEDHVTHPFLIAGSVLAQNKHRPRWAISNHTHARPNKDGLADAITSRREKDNALPMAILNLIDCLLNRVAVIRDAIAADRKLIGRQIHCRGIFQPDRVIR